MATSGPRAPSTSARGSRVVVGTDRQPSAWLESVLETISTSWTALARTATDATTTTERSIHLAGVDVHVVVHGEELARRLLPAFDGLAGARGPGVTVGAWDAAATGMAFPPRPAGPPDARLRGTVRRDGRAVGEVEWVGADLFRTGDRERRVHLLGVRTASVLTRLESSAPLRRALSWALGSEVLFTHSGAVGSADGVALLIGPSGAGKSSTALACVRAGLGFLSDDTCLVRGAPPVAYRIDSTARLFDRDVALVGGELVPVAMGRALGDPAAYSGDQTDVKAMFAMDRLRPELALAAAPVRVALVLEQGGERRPQLVPITAAEALRRNAPHVLLPTSIEPAVDLAAFRALLSSVPCSRLVLGTDRAANPEAVAEALAKARPA